MTTAAAIALACWPVWVALVATAVVGWVER